MVPLESLNPKYPDPVGGEFYFQAMEEVKSGILRRYSKRAQEVSGLNLTPTEQILTITTGTWRWEDRRHKVSNRVEKVYRVPVMTDSEGNCYAVLPDGTVYRYISTQKSFIDLYCKERHYQEYSLSLLSEPTIKTKQRYGLLSLQFDLSSYGRTVDIDPQTIPKEDIWTDEGITFGEKNKKILCVKKRDGLTCSYSWVRGFQDEATIRFAAAKPLEP